MKKFTFKNISENISISDSKNILNGEIINTSPDLDTNKDTCVNNYYSDNTPSAKSQIQIPVYGNSQFVTLLPGDDISIVTDNDLIIEYYTNVVNSLNSETYSFIDCKIEDNPGPDPQKPLNVPFSVLASDFIEGPTEYPTYIYEYGSDLALDKQYSIVLNSTSGESYSVDFTMESFDGALISYVEFDTQDTLPITDGYICNNASFDPEVGIVPGDSFMLLFMGDGTLEDFNRDIIDFKIKEASAPSTFTFTYDNDRVEALNFNFTSEDDVPQALFNAFDNLGQAYNITITCGESNDTKTTTIENARVTDTACVLSDDSVLPCRAFMPSSSMVVSESGPLGMNFIFSLTNDVNVTLNENTPMFIKDAEQDEDNLVILPLLQTDSSNFENGPVTYSFELIDENTYDMSTFVFGEILKRGIIQIYGGIVASSESESFGFSEGDYYQLNVSNGSDSVDIITKVMNSDLFGFNNNLGINDKMVVVANVCLTGESQNTLTFIDDIHVTDQSFVDNGSTILISGYMSTIYGPLNYTAPEHESFSVTIESDTTEVSDQPLTVQVGEFYSGTFVGTNSTKKLVGFVGVSDDDSTVKVLQLANVTDGACVDAQYEGNNNDGLNIFIPESGAITIERKGINLGDGTFTLDAGVYPQNQN